MQSILDNIVPTYLLIATISASIGAYIEYIKRPRCMNDNYNEFSTGLFHKTFWAAVWGWYTVPVSMFALPGYLYAKYYNNKTQIVNPINPINPINRGHGRYNPTPSDSDTMFELTQEQDEDMDEFALEALKTLIESGLVQKVIHKYDINFLCKAITDYKFKLRLRNAVVFLIDEKNHKDSVLSELLQYTCCPAPTPTHTPTPTPASSTTTFEADVPKPVA